MGELARPPVGAGGQAGRRADAAPVGARGDRGRLPGPQPGLVQPPDCPRQLVVPGGAAALLARAGDPNRALELFRLACRLDLDDLTGTSAGGLHVATMGGVWQALATGFLGLRPSLEALALDPRLPAAWQAVEVRCATTGTVCGSGPATTAWSWPPTARYRCACPGCRGEPSARPVPAGSAPGRYGRSRDEHDPRRARHHRRRQPVLDTAASHAGKPVVVPPELQDPPAAPPGVLRYRRGPHGPETAGRSAGAAAGRMREAQLGGMRLPPDRGGDHHDRDAVPFDQPRPPTRDRR